MTKAHVKASARIVFLLIFAAHLPSFGQQGTAFKEGATDVITGRDDSGSDRRPFVGPIYPEDLPPLFSDGEAWARWLSKNRVQIYGWLDGGVTTAGNASGLLTAAPVSNRFSNQAMLDAAWLTVERKTTKDLSWGFRGDFYAGSDAALLRPLNGFGPGGPRWGTDFRQAYFSLHTPGVFQGGIDWNFGRINVPDGFETLMGPYRPIYSESYYWITYEVGSTALQATLHPTKRLSVVLGPVMGYNTVFILRGRAPSYVGRVIYTPEGRKAQQWVATVYTGPEPFVANKGHIGSWQTLAELEYRRVWTPRIAQVLQMHYAADASDPGNRKRSSGNKGASVFTGFKLLDTVYLNTRLEWFDDPHGIRIQTLTPGTYSEATLGLSFLPKRWIDLRPEIRGDFAGQPSFGPVDARVRHRDQFSFGFELILKAHLIGSTADQKAGDKQ